MEKKRRREAKPKLYDEQVIEIKSIFKVTKGGRQRRVEAVVAVGDRKGKVGLGIAKALETPDAINKAIQSATKNMVTIPLTEGRTIAHEARGVCSGARVLLKPASAGTGVVAGGAVRDILDLVGISDILSKSLGSRTKYNVARATIDALTQIQSPEKIAKRRGKTVEEILG